MHRTQILLTQKQYEALSALGRRADKGLSELVRLAVDRLLGQEGQAPSGPGLKALRGIAKDPGGPSGSEHDRWLYGRPR